MHGKCVLENACTGPASVWRVREGNSLAELSGETVKVICWLSEREGLRLSSCESSGESVNVIGWLFERGESSGESVKVIGWLSERRGRLTNP